MLAGTSTPLATEAPGAGCGSSFALGRRFANHSRTIGGQAPVAGDLRSVIAAIHSAGDLERMGDLALHVAKAARPERHDRAHLQLRHPTVRCRPACLRGFGLGPPHPGTPRMTVSRGTAATPDSWLLECSGGVVDGPALVLAAG